MTATGALFRCPECDASFDTDACPSCHPDPEVQGGAASTRSADNYRKRLSRARRRRVFARDGHRCRWCGATGKLTIDHIVPISKGGTNYEANLQTLCERCNCSVKRDRDAA